MAGYTAADFDRMIAERRPDGLVVTTKDCFHDEYICRAMEQGCDVIAEKPLTTSLEKLQRILTATARTGSTLPLPFRLRGRFPQPQRGGAERAAHRHDHAHLEDQHPTDIPGFRKRLPLPARLSRSRQDKKKTAAARRHW